MSKKDAHICPFCREKINPTAKKCFHCLVLIPPQPQHKGTCPMCKEKIDPEATRCPHCKSWISSSNQLPGPFKSIQGDVWVAMMAQYDAEWGFAERFGPSRGGDRPGYITEIGPFSSGGARNCRIYIDWSTYGQKPGQVAIRKKCWDNDGALVFNAIIGWIAAPEWPES